MGSSLIKVSKAFKESGQAMQFVFDYGDEWRFLLELKTTGSIVPGITYPVLLSSTGEAPQQYRSWDEGNGSRWAANIKT